MNEAEIDDRSENDDGEDGKPPHIVPISSTEWLPPRQRVERISRPTASVSRDIDHEVNESGKEEPRGELEDSTADPEGDNQWNDAVRPAGQLIVSGWDPFPELFVVEPSTFRHRYSTRGGIVHQSGIVLATAIGRTNSLLVQWPPQAMREL